MKEYSSLVNSLNFEDVLLDTLPNPVYYKDIEGKFIRSNSAFSKLVNTPKKNIVGKVAYDFFPKSSVDKHKIIDKKLIQTLGTSTDKLIFPMHNGEVKYFVLNKAVYLNSDGSIGGMVCVMNDVTESTKQNEFLIQQSKLAEMGEMIASVAHQWNEPLVELSALVQKMELLYSMKKVNKVIVSDFTDDAMVQIKYMSDTLKDFRNFLKPSTLKKEFGIKKAIKELFDIVGKQIFYLNIKIDFDYKDEEIFVYGYENELKQVLLNIINNAKNKIVKLEDIKGIITIRVYHKKEFTVIEVEDNAGAIKAEVIEYLFEPFFTTKEDGLGYGLYLAKVIVEDKMNGQIKVENRSNNVIFSIKIPKI
ncbi:ATP-binding protein [Sulfurospirillum sp.]|nr:ATP-binding protein [Sulfurospirillum sp.]